MRLLNCAISGRRIKLLDSSSSKVISVYRVRLADCPACARAYDGPLSGPLVWPTWFFVAVQLRGRVGGIESFQV